MAKFLKALGATEIDGRNLQHEALITICAIKRKGTDIVQKSLYP